MGDTVTVKNRDIPLLSEIRYIMQEICQLEQRRQWQRERMMNITQHLTGMPGGGGMPKGLDDAFSLLSELETEHEARCRAYARKLKRAQKVLDGIGSEVMRAFVEMKYVQDRPDTEIRDTLGMTRRGLERARRCVEEAPRMAEVTWHERYIVRHTSTAEPSDD